MEWALDTAQILLTVVIASGITVIIALGAFTLGLRAGGNEKPLKELMHRSPESGGSEWK